jgi:hypothetical protein
LATQRALGSKMGDITLASVFPHPPSAFIEIRLVSEQRFHTFNDVTGVGFGDCSSYSDIPSFVNKLLRHVHGEHKNGN